MNLNFQNNRISPDIQFESEGMGSFFLGGAHNVAPITRKINLSYTLRHRAAVLDWV